MEKYCLYHTTKKNFESKNEYLVYRLRRQVFPEFDAILYFDEKIKFDPVVMNDCSPEEMKIAFDETISFIDSSSEVQSLDIFYSYDILLKTTIPFN